MKPGRTYYVHRCPHCQADHDCLTTGPGRRIPADGDVILCNACGQWMVQRVRAGERWMDGPSAELARDIACNPECQALRSAWLAAQLRRPPRIGPA